MRLLSGVVATGGCLLVAVPAYAEPVPVAEGVPQIEEACVASRKAFFDGGVVVLREKPKGDPVQVQRFDPVRGRVTDSGWPAIIVGYPAAVTVPLGFATMIAVSLATQATLPPGLSRTFARMHVPERLGMGIERLPEG